MKTPLRLTRGSVYFLVGLSVTGILLNICAAACLQKLTLTQRLDVKGHAAYYFSKEKTCRSDCSTMPLAAHQANTIETNNWPYQECLLLTDLAPSCDQYLRQH